MGRIFEKRKDRMFARWSKNAKAFTKIGKEIAIAIKLGGGDPNTNPRLRMAVQTARSLNMPKDRVEAAIKRAAGKDQADLQEISYEAYGPHGVALYIEAASDNGTRTVANIRSYLTKHGGALASSGALDYIFAKKGVFKIGLPPGDIDEFELEMIDHGLEEIFEDDEGLLLYADFKNFGDLQKAIEAKGIEVKSAAGQRIPNTYVDVTPEHEAELLKLIDKIEEDDDVQSVYHNMKGE